MKTKKVVYTCIVGDYDDVLEHQYIAPDWDYVLFTDNDELIKKCKIHHWNVRRNPFNKLDNTRNSRYVKINPHLVLPEYDYSFYLDGNININDNRVFDNLEQKITDNILVSIPLHPTRKCIYDEAKIIKDRLIDYTDLVKKQVSFLKSENYPKDNGLFENNLILRNHKDKNLIKAQDLWWQMILNYSKRDQLSGLYTFWKYNINIVPLYGKVGYHKNCEEITFVYKNTHNQNKIPSKQVIPNRFIKIMTCLIPIKKWRKKLRYKMQQIRKLK